MKCAEIMALLAGRELDTVVAKKVFGLIVLGPYGPTIAEMEFAYRDVKDFDCSRICYQVDLPHYSTDIAAAWEVVEKLRLSVWPNERGGWNCGRKPMEEDSSWAHGASAPLVICHAALLTAEAA